MNDHYIVRATVRQNLDNAVENEYADTLFSPRPEEIVDEMIEMGALPEDVNREHAVSAVKEWREENRGKHYK